MSNTRSVGIFIPVYHREDLVRRSIDSLLETIVENGSYNLSVFVLIGINGAGESLKTFLKEKNRSYSERGFSYSVFDHGKNIGKPASVNFLVNLARAGIKLDYIVSYDSDMEVVDPLWLLKLVEIYEGYKPPVGHAKIGALCPQQLEVCCHVLDKDPFTITFGNYHLTYRAGNEGTAGGVLFTSSFLWDTLRGYRAERLYASDDGHWMLDCANLGLLCPVVQEVALRHPLEANPGYASWKARACYNDLKVDESGGYWG